MRDKTLDNVVANNINWTHGARQGMKTQFISLRDIYLYLQQQVSLYREDILFGECDGLTPSQEHNIETFLESSGILDCNISYMKDEMKDNSSVIGRIVVEPTNGDE